ncbi:F-box/kelch-repeat protein At1g57790-like [Typha latifolia]|uniref:F-box/kelch-repeat protein At1g57790-like n=1 Tax=Typha latifolia TaxID=4733 RepID=UPI003C2FAB6F
METAFPNLDSQPMRCPIGSRRLQRPLDHKEEDMEACSNGDKEVGHLLLLRPRPTNMEDLGFFSLSQRNFADIKLPRAFRGSRCCGYSDGWMVMVSDKEFSITLLNLFSNEQFNLPSSLLSRFHYGAKFADGSIGYVTKVVLSSPPTSEDCIVAVMGQQQTIAFCQPRGDRWFALHANFVVEDIAFYNRKLHVLDYNGMLTAYNLARFPHATFAAVLHPKKCPLVRPDDTVVRVKRYLVESNGELLVVSRDYSGLEKDISFRVSKLVKDAWIPVKSLGDRALFIGVVRSVSVKAVGKSKIQQNCIYFTRKLIDLSGPHAIAAYCMEDKSIEPIPIRDQHSLRIEPVWI